MSSHNKRHPPMGSESDMESLGGSNAPSSSQYVAHSSDSSSEEIDEISLRVRALLSESDEPTPTISPQQNQPNFSFQTDEFDLLETSMYCDKAQKILIDEDTKVFTVDKHSHSLNIADKQCAKQDYISQIKRDISEDNALTEISLRVRETLQQSTTSEVIYSSHEDAKIQMHQDLSVRPKEKKNLQRKTKFKKRFLSKQQSSSSMPNISEKTKCVEEREPIISQHLINQNMYKNMRGMPVVLQNISEDNVIELAAPEEHSLPVEHFKPHICQPEDLPESYQRDIFSRPVIIGSNLLANYEKNARSPTDISNSEDLPYFRWCPVLKSQDIRNASTQTSAKQSNEQGTSSDFHVASSQNISKESGSPQHLFIKKSTLNLYSLPLGESKRENVTSIIVPENVKSSSDILVPSEICDLKFSQPIDDDSDMVKYSHKSTDCSPSDIFSSLISLKRDDIFSKTTKDGITLGKNVVRSSDETSSSPEEKYLKGTLPKIHTTKSKDANLSSVMFKDTSPEEKSVRISTQTSYSLKMTGMFSKISQDGAKLRENVVRSFDETSSSSEDTLPKTPFQFSKDPNFSPEFYPTLCDGTKEDGIGYTISKISTALPKESETSSVIFKDTTPEVIPSKHRGTNVSTQTSLSSLKKADMLSDISPDSVKSRKNVVATIKEQLPFILRKENLRKISSLPSVKPSYRYLEERTFENVAETKNERERAVIIHGMQSQIHYCSDPDMKLPGSPVDNKKEDDVTTAMKFQDAASNYKDDDDREQFKKKLLKIWNETERKKADHDHKQLVRELGKKDEDVSLESENYDIIFPNGRQTIVCSQNSPLYFDPKSMKPLRRLRRKSPSFKMERPSKKSSQECPSKKRSQECPSKKSSQECPSKKSPQECPSKPASWQIPLTPKKIRRIEKTKKSDKTANQERAKRFSNILAKSASKGKVHYSLHERVVKRA